MANRQGHRDGLRVRERAWRRGPDPIGSRVRRVAAASAVPRHTGMGSGPDRSAFSNLTSLVNGASTSGGWVQVVIQRVCSQTYDPGSYSACVGSAGSIELDTLTAFLDWVGAAGQAGGAPAGTTIAPVRDVIASVDTAPAVDSDRVQRSVLCHHPVRRVGGRIPQRHGHRRRGGGHALHPGRLRPVDQQRAVRRPVHAPGYRDRFLPLLGRGRERRTGANGHRQRRSGPRHVRPDHDDHLQRERVLDVAVHVRRHGRPERYGYRRLRRRGDVLHDRRLGPDDIESQLFGLVQGAPGLDASPFFSIDHDGNAEAPRQQRVELTPARVTVSLTWDDGTSSQYALGWQRAMQPHGVLGTFYIVSGDVGGGPIAMTWTQIAGLEGAGNEIGGHTVHHINMKTTTNYQTKVQEVCDDWSALIARGLHPTSFAYPFGAYDATAEEIVQGCGYANARGAGGITRERAHVRGNGAATGPVRDTGMVNRRSGAPERPPEHDRHLFRERRRLGPDRPPRGVLADVRPRLVHRLHRNVRMDGASTR